jgi:hypothetical protein
MAVALRIKKGTALEGFTASALVLDSQRDSKEFDFLKNYLHFNYATWSTFTCTINNEFLAAPVGTLI